MNNDKLNAILDDGISDNFKKMSFDDNGNPLDPRLEPQKKHESKLLAILDDGISENFKNLQFDDDGNPLDFAGQGGAFAGHGASGRFSFNSPQISQKPFELGVNKVEPEYTDSTMNNLWLDMKEGGGKIKDAFFRGGEDFVSAMSNAAEMMGVNSLKEFNDNLRTYKAAEDTADPIDSDNYVTKSLYAFSRMTPRLAAIAGTTVITGGTGGFALAALEGAGNMYKDLTDEGIDTKIALPLSIIGGSVYGGIEQLQVTQAAPWIKQSLNKLVASSINDAVKKVTQKEGLKQAGKFVFNLSSEVAEEVAQDMSDVAFKNISRGINDIVHDTDKMANAPMLKEQINQYLNTAKDSVGPLLIATLMGHGTGALIERAKNKSETQNNNSLEESAKPVSLEQTNEKIRIIPEPNQSIIAMNNAGNIIRNPDYQETSQNNNITATDDVHVKDLGNGIKVWIETNPDGSKTWVGQMPNLPEPVALWPDMLQYLDLPNPNEISIASNQTENSPPAALPDTQQTTSENSEVPSDSTVPSQASPTAEQAVPVTGEIEMRPGAVLEWTPRSGSKWGVKVLGEPLPDGSVEIEVIKAPGKKNIGETHIITPDKLNQLSEPQSVQTRRKYKEELDSIPQQYRKAVKEDASTFDSLVKDSEIFYDIFDLAEKAKNGNQKNDAITENTALKKAREKAFEYLGIDDDPHSPMARAKHLEAFREWLNTAGKDIETANKTKRLKETVEGQGEEKIYGSDIKDGDQVNVKGEWMIANVDEETGDITLKDGTKITLDPADEINVAGGEIVSQKGEVKKPSEHSDESFDVSSEMKKNRLNSSNEPASDSYAQRSNEPRTEQSVSESIVPRSAENANPDIDLSSKPPMKPIEVPGHTFTQESLSDAVKAAKAWAKENFAGKSFVNDDTGFQVNITSQNLEHGLSPNHPHIRQHIELIRKLPDVVKNMVKIETHHDKKNETNLKQVHRFVVPINMSDRIYAVKLTVKENTQEHKFYYDHALTEIKEIKKPSLGSDKQRSESEGLRNDWASGISISDILSVVKGYENKLSSDSKNVNSKSRNATGGTSQNASIRQDGAELPPTKSNDLSDSQPVASPELVRFARSLGIGTPQIFKKLRSLGLFSHSGSIKLKADIFIGPEIKTIYVKKENIEEAKKGLDSYARKKLNIPPNAPLESVAEIKVEYDNKTRRYAVTLYKIDPEYAPFVMAHEIGHAYDWKDNGNMKRGNILGHIAALHKYMTHMLSLVPDQPTISKWDKRQIVERAKLSFQPTPGEKINDRIKKMRRDYYNSEIKRLIKERNIKTRDEILAELKALTKWWHPFDEKKDIQYTRYRHSPVELYADAISVLLNQPQELVKRAPAFYQLFVNYAINRPEASAALNSIYQDIRSGDIHKKRVESLRNGFDEGEKKFIESIQKEDKRTWGNAIRDTITLFINSFAAVEQYAKQARKRGLAIDNDPVYASDRYNYSAAQHEHYVGIVNEKVLKPLKENNIDWNTFGEYLYHKRVVNERRTMANPDGWTSKLSSERLTEMQKELGDSFLEMEKAAKDFWEIRKNTIIKSAQESKMFSEPLIKKMADNENYVTFDVVKFIDQEHGSGTGARIYQQVGTLEKIRNPATATMAKDMAILRSIEWNNTKRLTCQMFQGFFPDKIQDADKRFVNNHHEYIPKNTGDIGTVTYMLNGKVQSFYLDREIADVFERQNKFAMGFYSKGLMYSADVFRTLFTQIKVGFTLANFIRDFQRTVKNLPGYKVIYRILPEYIKALPEAWHSTANELTPVVSEMLQKNMLISIADTRNLNSLDTQIERMVATWNVTARERFNEMPIYQKIPSVLLWYSVRAGRTVERISKIAGYLYLKNYRPDMHPEEVARRVREEIGSPDFLKRGIQTNWTNSIALFSNAIVQSWRSDFKAIKNDRTVLVKTILASTPYHALLWTAKAGLLYGAMKAIFGDDDDKTKYFKKIYEILQRIPDYDCMNYNIIPIGISPNNQALYLRLPQDENAKLIGGILWTFLNTFKGKFEPMDIFKTLNYASDQLPGVNPVFALTHGVLSYCGINIMGAGMPDDLQKQMTETMWKARWQSGARLDTLSEFGKWAWNTAGLSYFWKFQTEAQRNAPDEEGVYGMIQDSQSLPIVNDIISRFLKVSDTGITAEVKQEALNPLRNEKAGESVIKKRIIQALYDGKGTSNFDDQERTILTKYRKDIIKEVRELRALRGASAEQRAILDTRSKEEKRTVRQFLNEK